MHQVLIKLLATLASTCFRHLAMISNIIVGTALTIFYQIKLFSVIFNLCFAIVLDPSCRKYDEYARNNTNNHFLSSLYYCSFLLRIDPQLYIYSFNPPLIK